MNGKFNPEEHMITLKGKKYLQVMWRLVWFREEHPDWTIITEVTSAASGFCMFKATILDETGRALSTGHGSETSADFGDYIEKAETKAVGRCLAMLGYGTQFSPDLDEGDRIVDSPVAKTAEPKKPTRDELMDALNKGLALIVKKTGGDPEEIQSEIASRVGLLIIHPDNWEYGDVEAALTECRNYYGNLVYESEVKK